MFVRRLLTLTVLALALSAGVGPRPGTAPSPALAASVILQPIATGLSAPVGIAHAGDSSNRLFILEQTGRVRVHAAGALLPAPFLDLTGEITCCGEQGLLGIAFHPNYESTGVFYVNYTDLAADTVIARYSVSANPDVANAASKQVVLTVGQPAAYANHRGGDLHFGPDGYLYIGMGDGGGIGDPLENGQNRETLLGKMLRINVDGTPTYTVPANNPLVGVPGRDEIWAIGLRNPWRFSFDRLTNDLIIADVGQFTWEEVNVQAAGVTALRDYGWNTMEANVCYAAPTCDATGLTLPALQYGHGAGNCAIAGGYVYRGSLLPDLAGQFVFGDFCSGRIWEATRGAAPWPTTEITQTGFLLSAFGEDEAGELYITDYSAGRVLKLLPAPDTDGDGCSDIDEGGPDHVIGGQRNPADFWDFFDVTNDRVIDLSDAIDVLSYFGADGSGASNLRDRSVPVPAQLVEDGGRQRRRRPHRRDQQSLIIRRRLRLSRKKMA